jgi:hypothetical protein
MSIFGRIAAGLVLVEQAIDEFYRAPVRHGILFPGTFRAMGAAVGEILTGSEAEGADDQYPVTFGDL